MKRILTLLFAILLAAPAAPAQPSQRQKTIHMAAVRIAGAIGVRDADREAFIALYQNYKKESAEIMRAAPAAAQDPEDAVEAKILCDFEKSERLLALRKAYYAQFRTLLSPSQIQKMYDEERTGGKK